MNTEPLAWGLFAISMFLNLILCISMETEWSVSHHLKHAPAVAHHTDWEEDK